MSFARMHNDFLDPDTHIAQPYENGFEGIQKRLRWRDSEGNRCEQGKPDMTVSVFSDVYKNQKVEHAH